VRFVSAVSAAVAQLAENKKRRPERENEGGERQQKNKIK
jgi:hypothetical protein